MPPQRRPSSRGFRAIQPRRRVPTLLDEIRQCCLRFAMAAILSTLLGLFIIGQFDSMDDELSRDTTLRANAAHDGMKDKSVMASAVTPPAIDPSPNLAPALMPTPHGDY